MTTAAGVLFLTPEGEVLFLKRGDGAVDFPGAWCFPGGHAEAGETAEECALREATEECGPLPKGIKLAPWTRTVNTFERAEESPPTTEPRDVDFTTFVCRVPEKFEPTRDDEHVGHAWAPISGPPQPLHPGCAIAIERIDMDELGVATAMSEGRLASPQTYENVTLFAIRITGTGVAYRESLKEYVWREPEIYLNDEFVRRCGGLSVIMEHPKGMLLNSKEFGDRKIGAVMFAYVRGDEVWGIAKIYDAAAVKLMTERQLSTSPGVSWRDMSVNVVLKQDDGSKLLIEGKPSLLDHIAICERGVWDKGGKPQGVLNDVLAMERVDMADEKKKEGERVDAEAGEKLDLLLSHVDSIGKRFDAFEKRMDSMEEDKKARDDAAAKCAADAEEDEKKKKEEEAKADKARKDAEGDDPEMAADKARKDKARKDAEDEKEEKEEKERADAARADSAASVDQIRAEVDKIKKEMPKHMTDADHASLRKAQARADTVYQMFGKHASRAMQSETLQEYRLRIADDLKEHSAAWKASNLAVVAVDDAAFDVAEAAIYEDARKAALNPTDLREDELRMITRTDSVTGRVVNEFVGKRSFIHGLSMPAQFVTKINRQDGRAAAEA